jgi:hypothetical protein
LTRLEEDRDFPNANLLGMRLDLKPTEGLQIGLSRVFMFGGKGRRPLDASDWLNVFIASDSAEHESSPINGNQIASLDISYVYVSASRYIPFSGIKLYTEWGAEDSSGKTRTPKGKASVFGAFVDEPLWLKNFDFRAELANTARNAVTGFSWYRHNVYSSGYTYHGNIIGHHMGPDARDLFLRARYHLPGGGALGVEHDRERSDVHFANTYNERTRLGADASIALRGVNVSGGYGVEKDRREGLRNNVAWVRLSRSF